MSDRKLATGEVRLKCSQCGSHFIVFAWETKIKCPRCKFKGQSRAVEVKSSEVRGKDIDQRQNLGYELLMDAQRKS